MCFCYEEMHFLFFCPSASAALSHVNEFTFEGFGISASQFRMFRIFKFGIALAIVYVVIICMY